MSFDVTGASAEEQAVAKKLGIKTVTHDESVHSKNSLKVPVSYAPGTIGYVLQNGNRKQRRAAMKELKQIQKNKK